MNDEKSFISVIRSSGFFNLWINQILVQLSYNSLNFALLIWVYHLTQSNTAVSALLFAIYLPSVIFGLFAGVLIDITDRRKIILIINILMSLSFISLIFLKESYFAILAISFFINTLSQFYAPAESSAIPLIVKKEHLLMANSIFTTTLFSAFLVGFGLAGPMSSYLGINYVFGIGALLLFIAFILALKFPSIVNKSDEEGRVLLRAVKKRDFKTIENVGILEVKKTIDIIRGKWLVLFSILILSGVQIVVGVLAVLIPGFLEREIHINATDASYVLILPLGIGMILGGYFIGKFGYKFPRRIIAARGILIAGFLFFLVGIAPIISPVIKHFPKVGPQPFFYQPSLASILAVGSFFLGIALASILIPSQTVLQENAPEANRGKIFSVLGVMMQGLSLIPVLLVGVLADLVGFLPIFMAMGGIIALVGLFILKPNFFFEKNNLAYKFREFLGLGHWEKKN